MSVTMEPATTHHASGAGGINLVARARPYFGLIVLTTSLLTAFGIVAMLRMPSGIYPEVAFPRIVVIAQTPGLGVKDVEVAVTRPIEEVVGIVLGGLHGSISVSGMTYNGMMPAWKGTLSNKDVADVITYIRGSLGNNKASAVTEAQVASHK